MNEFNNLKFRRQFIISGCAFEVNDTWKNYPVYIAGKVCFISYHPDLELVAREDEYHRIILLGYILDPENPAFDNEKIVSVLLGRKSFDEVLACTKNYNGRYVIIYCTREKTYLFHDATGFREVYYTLGGEFTACGSTPDILAARFNTPITKDPDVLSFYNSKQFADHNNTWVGYRTLFDKIMHLPPNHYLDLLSGKITRYWPAYKLEIIDIDACAKACAQLLKGTLASAHKRFELHMGITAGWDTRLLLAAVREFRDFVFLYVNKTTSLSDYNKDIRIPRRLARKLGLTLNVIDIEDNVTPGFEACYYRNNILAHKALLPVFYQVYRNKWENTVTVSGTMGNGLARIYMPLFERCHITGKYISQLAGYDGMDYVIRELDPWCREVLPFCMNYDINILDLYQWEQENAHWAALTASEQDIVRDEVRPFNNRGLIELFWSLDNKYRYQYFPIIYIKIIRLLWKEVLDVPINPSYKTAFYKILRIFGIEQRIYHLYKKSLVSENKL